MASISKGVSLYLSISSIATAIARANYDLRDWDGAFKYEPALVIIMKMMP